jgi:hypothetical protein
MVKVDVLVESVTLMCARGQNSTTVTKIVTKVGAKQAKTSKLQKTETVAKVRLAKGFS